MLTLEHLTGEGAYSQPSEQATNLPRPVLDDIKNSAKKALMQVPDGNTPTHDFVDTKQGPGESYMKFIDHLKQTIEKQIIEEKAKDKLVKKLGMSNANPKCKKV